MKLGVPVRIAVLSLVAAYSRPAFSAQTDISISTTAPPAAPRILGATVIGSTPGSPFLYTISATGQAPLTFAATGLPDGLSIAASSGTISGTTPVAGSYPINVTITNGSGSAAGTLTLTSGSTLALTPPMGWNSYDSFYASVTEKDVLAAAQAMKTLLQPYGWNTVVIDYLWYDSEQTIDANGRWLPSKSKYPSATGSDGFKALAAQVHALGLSFGIHLMRGIPRKAVTANSPIANSSYTASQAGNTSDTCSWDNHMYGVRADTAAGKAWYDSIYAQYAEWGVDFVKVDDMMNPYGGNVLHSTEVEAVHASIGKTVRSMVLSLSPGPNQPKDVAVLNANANMWRTVNDFWDTNGLSSLSDEFTATYNWSTTSGITPGHWPDADMLPLGTIGTRACAFSHNQQVTVMSLWAIMPSPLMFGGQLTKLSTDSWTLALLTNEEVLAVNQDALGSRGKRITQQGSTEVWAKDLSGGRKAVAMFNRDTQDATVSVTFTQLGLSGTLTVRDLWHRADVTGLTTGISVNVPHEGALMYTVSPPGGTGGSGGSGAGGNGAGGAGSGGSGGGGAAGTSGDAGRGGAPGSGGASGQGGVAGGGAGGAAAGGAGGVAGATGLGGTGGGSGRGGAQGSGGTSGTGGATSSAGGSSGTAGSVGGAGDSSVTGAGGRGGSPAGGDMGSMGGLPGTGGRNTATGGNSGAGTAGCSCSLQSRRSAPVSLLLACALALLAARRRKGT
jgi:alpha-galactosidase